MCTSNVYELHTPAPPAVLVDQWQLLFVPGVIHTALLHLPVLAPV